MAGLRPEVQRFLERNFPLRTVIRLAGDASTRAFFRVTGRDGSSRVVMDYGSSFSGESKDEALSRVFFAAGLPVARIVASSPEEGCLLLEDLGDRTLESLLETSRSSETRKTWIERAVRLAAEIANRGTAVLTTSDRAEGPALDSERFRFEMEFFLRHGAPEDPDGRSEPAGLRDALMRLADLAAETPRRVLCHRDFHSRNLMVRSDGSLAMVDIQDARWGPDSYDLASLLRDAYVELDDDWIDPMIDAYLGQLEQRPDAGRFRQRFHVVAAQRMIKALGTFGYQGTVLGRNRYREAARRTARRLRAWLGSVESTRDLEKLLTEAGLLDHPTDPARN